MKVIQCPEYRKITSINSVFLAGGISNCPNWQEDVIESLHHRDITLINPRREDYTNTFDNAHFQINWERHYLLNANIISFWFCQETLCPITLFELGCWVSSGKKLIVGIHPEYQRKTDLQIQLNLINNKILPVYSLESLVDLIDEYTK